MSGISYTRHGDYYEPDLFLPEQKEVTYGMFGRMRRKFMKEYRPGDYYTLLTNCKLNEYLAEIDKEASERMEVLVQQMATSEGVTEQMKAEDMMKWVRLMNNIRNSAQEIVKNQVI
ncbi:MAG: TnpV protein, partial [Acutalibacteraceae bacterium]